MQIPGFSGKTGILAMLGTCDKLAGVYALPFGKVPIITYDFSSGPCRHFGENINFISLIPRIVIKHPFHVSPGEKQ